MHPETQIGAMINPQHMEKVLGYIKSGQEQGASLVYGGDRVTVAGGDQEFTQGSFLSPAIFDHCTDDMKLVQEEIFGMVASVLSFETEDEVIQRVRQCSSCMHPFFFSV